MNKLTYSYRGPLPLGSVVAHYCGAAGLTTYKEGPTWLLVGEEQATQYSLAVYENGTLQAIFTGSLTNEGRLHIGGQLLRLLRTHQGLAPLGDWGTLVGVRPTKLFHKLWDQLGSAEAAVERLRTQYEVTEPKLSLLAQVTGLQRPYVAPSADSDRLVSVYGGIPFCQTHCTYCSFPYGLLQDYKRVPQFVEAFVADSEHLQSLLATYHLQLSTLYVGGGTPTSLGEADFETVITALAKLLAYSRTAKALEFTVEAGRPDSVTPYKLQTMARQGVNRISINPQSMQDSILKAIGRGHTAQAIKDLYEYVRLHTPFQVNMDFIAGLPYQQEVHMIGNMDYVCQAMPENVTIHTLALKRGSPLYEGVGREAMPEEKAVQAMVAYCKERLEAAGYVPYYVYRQQYMTSQTENIGYTLPGHVCEYNIRIMEERQSILSVGPGSSSKWMRAPEYRQLQQHMPKDVSVYIDTLDTLLGKRSQLCKQFWEG